MLLSRSTVAIVYSVRRNRNSLNSRRTHSLLTINDDSSQNEDLYAVLSQWIPAR